MTLGGRPLELTATEYELLRVLSTNPGRVLTYRALLRLAWGTRYCGSVNPRLVHAVVRRLRDKLGEDGARPSYIINERRVGYRMPAPGDRPAGPDQAKADSGRAAARLDRQAPVKRSAR